MGGIVEQSIRAGNCLGQNIRKARLAKKLTQEQLATRLQLLGCDMSRGTYAKIEMGIRHITVPEIDAIKEILDMEYEDFFAQD